MIPKTIDNEQRTARMVDDLEGGMSRKELASKYQLSLPYIRKLLREVGCDHLLDGAKPRLRKGSAKNV